MIARLLMIAALLAPAAALGADPRPSIYQPTPEAIQDLPWLSDAYRPCQQNCLYQKANEALASQALFLYYRIKNMDEALWKDSPKDVVERNVPGFCVSSDAGDSCWQRFLHVQRRDLRQIQISIAKNNEMMMSLKSDQATPIGPHWSAEIFTPGSPAAVPMDQRKTVDASMQTFQGLAESYDRAGTAKTSPMVITNDYISWVDDQVKNVAPSKEEFILYKTIKRDPSDPKSETFTVPDTSSCHQAICYDTIAYNKAMEKYTDPRKSELKKQFEDMKKEFAKRGLKNQQKLMKATVGEETFKAYRKARGRFVTTVNQSITGKKNFVTPGPAPMLGGDVTKPVAPAKPPGTATTTGAGRTPAKSHSWSETIAGVSSPLGKNTRGGTNVPTQIDYKAQQLAEQAEQDKADEANADRLTVEQPKDNPRGVNLIFQTGTIDDMMKDKSVTGEP